MPIDGSKLPKDGESLDIAPLALEAILKEVSLPESVRVQTEDLLAKINSVNEENMRIAETAEQHIAVMMAWVGVAQQVMGILQTVMPLATKMLQAKMTGAGATGLSPAQQQTAQDCWLKNLLSGKPLWTGMPPEITTALGGVLPANLSSILFGA